MTRDNIQGFDKGVNRRERCAPGCRQLWIL